MILDTLAHSTAYENLHPGIARAFAWLKSQPLATLEDGTYPIDGKKIYVIVQSPAPKSKGECRLECHRKYIDIQCCVSGMEEMGWAPVEGNGHPLPFDEEKDLGFFEDRPQSWFEVRPGTFAIFFPGDAHAPNAADGTHKKAIVKVLL